MQTIDDLIQQGETATEHQQHAEALLAYEQAILLAGDSKDYIGIVRALSQKLIIFKHKYQITGDKVYLELLKGDVETSSAIVAKYNIAGHPRAVITLRRGDYYFENEDFGQAAEYYKQAVDLLPKADIAEPEFLGHYGLALVLHGDSKGLDFLNQGLNIAEEDSRLKPFHKMIIVSGIHMRLAEARDSLGDQNSAQEHIKIAQEIATQLDLEHNMGMRLVQLGKLKEKLNF